jgi:hypothetical protein
MYVRWRHRMVKAHVIKWDLTNQVIIHFYTNQIVKEHRYADNIEAWRILMRLMQGDILPHSRVSDWQAI